MATFRSFWFGEISPYEWLSMKSFVDHGHRYILYVYDEMEVPAGVELADASQVLPRDRIFLYGDKAGIGRGSIAGFANLFRYELLYRFGDWWVDTDVVCMSDYVPSDPVFLGWEDEKVIGNAILKFPERHPFVASLKSAAERAGANLAWGETGPGLVTRLIESSDLINLVSSPVRSYPISSADALHLLNPSRRAEVEAKVRDVPLLHMWHEVRRRAVVLPWIAPTEDSFAAGLFRRYGVTFPSGYSYTGDQLERLSDNYMAFTEWDWHQPRIASMQAILDAAREDLDILRRRAVGGLLGMPDDFAAAQHPGNRAVALEASCPQRNVDNLIILDHGPRLMRVGTGFNIQPNGRSAIWLIASRHPPARCRISFDGEVLKTVISDRILTAEIPQPLLDTPRKIRVSLVGQAGEWLADTVEFSLQPR